MRLLSRWVMGPAVVVLGFLGGCHEMGRLGDGPGDIYRDRGDDRIVGHITRVHPKAGELEIRADGGRDLHVRYDDRTRVVYRQRDYGVENLEPGDSVAMRVRDSHGTKPYAELIRVEQSVREREPNARARLEKLDGVVEFVDRQRGIFELNDGGRRRVTVFMPHDPARRDEDRFRRLREGDHVRMEGHFVDRGRFDLETFL